MGPLDIVQHLLHFFLPAFAVAAGVTLIGRWRAKAPASPRSAWMRWAIQSAVGSAVLLGGLWLLGRDGKMATYAALVVAVATSHWLMHRGWRR